MLSFDDKVKVVEKLLEDGRTVTLERALLRQLYKDSLHGEALLSAVRGLESSIITLVNSYKNGSNGNSKTIIEANAAAPTAD